MATPAEREPTSVPNEAPVEPALALEPLTLGASLVVAALAAALSMHVFFVFGVVPGAELLVPVILGAAGTLRLTRRGVCRVAPVVYAAALSATTAAALGFALPIGLASAGRAPDLVPAVMLGAAFLCGAGLAALAWLTGSEVDRPPRPNGALADLYAGGRVVRIARLLVLCLGLAFPRLGFVGGPPLASAAGLSLLGDWIGIGALAVGCIVRPVLPYAETFGVGVVHLPEAMLLGAGVGAFGQVALLSAWAALRHHFSTSRRAHAVHPPPPRRPPATTARTFPRRWVPRFGLVFGLYALSGLVTFAAADLGPLDLTTTGLLSLGLAAAVLAAAFQLFGRFAGPAVGAVPALGAGVVVIDIAARLHLESGAALLLIALVVAGGPLVGELARQLIPGSAGRGQQILGAGFGLAAALAVVGAGYSVYLDRGFVPPAATALAAGLDLSSQPGAIRELAPWLGLGVVLQLIGGPSRQVGVLLATGLLIGAPEIGWTLLGGLAARIALAVVSRGRHDTNAAIFGLGCIAGEMAQTALLGP